MSGAAPMWLMVPVFVLQALVTLGRWLLVNDTHADELINRALSFSAVCVFSALWDTDLGADGYPSKVFLVCGALALASVYGLAELFDGADSAAVRRRQWAYDLLAVSGAVSLLLGDGLAAPATWWRTTLWVAIFQLPMAAAGVRTVRACLREMPRTRSRLERIAYSALLVTAAYWCGAAFFAAATSVFDGVTYPTRWTVTSCLVYLFVTTLTAIPMVRAFGARSGLDRTGRELRTLHPLWRDLTAAVPEVVLHPAAGRITEPDSRLYRMVVETRDALQHLRMYMPRDDSGELGIAAYARRIAQAVDAKAAGAAPSAERAARENPYAGQDLDAELGHLLELARAWPGAVSEPVRANRR
ncbi:MAB_1171c family putative transporter [Nocardia lijiangensis]|uniref:MAB_1171c family putative transporter n=1 Tax=Nocardia lijiangensis TaxID=299618 RepID=UPI0012DBDA5E|nr:MAB_1171c family putative transporter [Nocardia lijiangensis]